MFWWGETKCWRPTNSCWFTVPDNHFDDSMESSASPLRILLRPFRERERGLSAPVRLLKIRNSSDSNRQTSPVSHFWFPNSCLQRRPLMMWQEHCYFYILRRYFYFLSHHCQNIKNKLEQKKPKKCKCLFTNEWLIKSTHFYGSTSCSNRNVPL